MKWILLLCSCLTCSAQFPYSGTTWKGPSSAPFDFNSVANLYIELFADSAANWSGNTNGGTTLGTWLDQTSFHNDFTNGATIIHYVPGYRFGNGPTNGWYVDFHTNTTTAALGWAMQCVNSPGSNQPNAVFMVCTVKFNPSGYFDAISGSRELFQARAVGSVPNNSTMFAGTLAAPNPFPVSQDGLWYVFSFVFNGASSYVRTNGVIMSGGLDPGANALGKMMLGNDQTVVTPYNGYMAAVLVYGQSPSTNDLQAIEKNLSKKYGHIYPDGL